MVCVQAAAVGMTHTAVLRHLVNQAALRQGLPALPAAGMLDFGDEEEEANEVSELVGYCQCQPRQTEDGRSASPIHMPFSISSSQPSTTAPVPYA